jgi:hypothetical protein
MREDMSEVLIERPRAGGRGVKDPKGYKKNLGKDRDFENSPKKESMRKRWKASDSCKELTDLLGPLRRYLAKQVGRKWDDVYSEIAAKMPQNSMAKSHVRDHIFQYVTLAKDIRVVKGKPDRVYRKAISSWSGGEVNSSKYTKYYYVHPETGILKIAPLAKERKYKPTVVVHMAGNEYAVYKNDTWYLMTTKPFNKGVEARYKYLSDSKYDTILGRHLYQADAESIYKRNVVGDKIVCQLSKRDIKEWNLEAHLAV